MDPSKVWETFAREWPFIKQAPMSFMSACFVVCCIACGTYYWIFKQNLDRKDDLIRTLQSQLAAKPTQTSLIAPTSDPPNFRLLLSGGNVFIPDGEPGLTGIALNVAIINTGSPSIATDWRLSIVPEVGTPKQAQLTKMPASLVARGEKNMAQLNSAESLDESTFNNPVETNVPRTGKLLFYVSLTKDVVMRAVLQLSVKDVKGRSFIERQDMKDWLAR
jgi:hypothetical protein